MECFAIHKIIGSYVTTNRIKKFHKKFINADENSRKPLTDKLFEKNSKFFSKIVNHQSNVDKLKYEIIKELLKQDEAMSEEIFNVVLPSFKKNYEELCYDAVLSNSHVLREAIKEIFEILNMFLFHSKKFTNENRIRLLSFIEEFVAKINECFDDISTNKVDFLIRIYFGIQFISYYSMSNFEIKEMGLNILETILISIHEHVHLLETTFYFDSKKEFMKMSLSYDGEAIFDSFDDKISKFYFKFISEIISDNNKTHMNVLEWAQGNMISVLYSIKEERIAVMAQKQYIESLCKIAFNKLTDQNMLLALKCIKKILKLSPKCKYLVESFFSKRSIDISRLLRYVQNDQMEFSKVDVFQIKSLLVPKYSFQNNLFQSRSTHLADIKICFHQ